MRLVFALFMDEVPLAAFNFHALCTQRFAGVGEAGQPLTFRRSKILRIARGQFLQGGDTTGMNGGGGDSIFGKNGFEDEPLGLRMLHNASGLLSMANHGPDTNRSQFLITLGEAPSLDGKHVILGRIISGAMHLQTLDSLPLDSNDSPVETVTIVECGSIPGWHRPPVPLAENVKKEMTLPALDKRAAAQREAISQAVQEALQKRAAPEEATNLEPNAKRAASSSPVQPYQGGAANSAMMALPFADDDSSDNDDDELEGSAGNSGVSENIEGAL
eukprot:CAMPEP_0119334010 /NCGR_PEP_ID=MMETSP1333-20130426/86493_1 /TAXON_ID=418940 /ORGANISM="Scyphosphaera apsteinii, Strain RCC1455" /LENGTH=273 /DNA_ID=CAMNT_0007344221 /DNA_START=71 /DNA_END=892 /DNA_ORIENTATION=-